MSDWKTKNGEEQQSLFCHLFFFPLKTGQKPIFRPCVAFDVLLLAHTDLVLLSPLILISLDDWLNNQQGLHDQDVGADDTLVLGKRFFVFDANIDRSDPVQLLASS